ncbi:MAG: GspH/FimT family pseudopilin [Pacificimonas sp.]
MNHRARTSPIPARQGGFTLVETLVVLAILGALAGVAVLSVGAGDRGAIAERAANRLANHLTLAADESLITGAALRLSWDQDGYVFETGGEGDWQPHGDDSLGLRQDLARGLTLTGDATRLVILPGGLGPPARFKIVGTRDWLIMFDGLSATTVPA